MNNGEFKIQTSTTSLLKSLTTELWLGDPLISLLVSFLAEKAIDIYILLWINLERKSDIVGIKFMIYIATDDTR